LAPVVRDSFSNAGGEKSKLGTPGSGFVSSDSGSADGSALAAASVSGFGGGVGSG
jgi:hypothetical protein